jgi:hypothetical protein
MNRYHLRHLAIGCSKPTQEELKSMIRVCVYNARFRTMKEGENSSESVLTFTPEPHEVGKLRQFLNHNHPYEFAIVQCR